MRPEVSMRRTLLPLLLLAACQPDSLDGVITLDDPSLLPTDESPPPLSAGYLELGVNALDIGEAVNLRARGAYPGDVVQFFRGAGHGAGPCITPSLCHEILSPVPLGTATANAQGIATYTFTMPSAPIGATGAFEAMVPTGNVASSSAEVRNVRAGGSTGPYRIGNWHPQLASGSISPNAMIFQTVEVTETVNVVGFSFRATTAGGNFKAALYSDSGGQPGTLIAQSAATPVVIGNANASATSSPSLAPGRYWIAATFSTDVFTNHNTLQSEPEYIILQPFGSAFPTTYSGGSFYVSVGIAVSLGVR
jgi:hypothetical protein